MNKQILIISDGSMNTDELRIVLENEYQVVITDEKEYDIDVMIKQEKIPSAIIICADIAVKNDYEILKRLSSETSLFAVPILVYCKNVNYEEEYEECLVNGVSDIIYPPLRKNIFLNRIKNFIRLKDSVTFYEIERILRALPSNIYLKDKDGKYIFATHYWYDENHTEEPDWSIRGKTDIEVRKDRENAEKAMIADEEVIKTGKGSTYTIEIDSGGKHEFMEVIKRPVHSSDGEITGIVALINNITERELLRISLEELAMIDELTHVYNRRAFDDYLVSLKKSKSYPISIISADCNDLKKINDTYGHTMGDEYIVMSTLLFRMNSTIQKKEKFSVQEAMNL